VQQQMFCCFNPFQFFQSSILNREEIESKLKELKTKEKELSSKQQELDEREKTLKEREKEFNQAQRRSSTDITRVSQL
jgi:uncharacterized protein YabN with tetrapyrrole methylase and pyrophosphatase domain